ncbi:MAG: hypothetical protein ACTS77_04145 [Arsenophonus sp. NC-TX2-MAG3]
MILNVAIIAIVVGYMAGAFTTPNISYFVKVTEGCILNDINTDYHW